MTVASSYFMEYDDSAVNLNLNSVSLDVRVYVLLRYSPSTCSLEGC